MTARAAVLVASDSRSAGAKKDSAGALAGELLRAQGFEVSAPVIVPDEQETLEQVLITLCRSHDLVITTGGTGLSPRDRTPEATLAVGERVIPGLAELMRAAGREKTPRAVLSRAVAVQRGQSLIINLPGSPKGVRECLQALAPVLGHAVETARGPYDHDGEG